MKPIKGWMIFDEDEHPETFKIEKNSKGSIIFKTLTEARKHSKTNYKIRKVTINPHRFDYNMNIK